MKKLLTAFLAVALVAACGDDKKDNKPAKGSPEKPTVENAEPAATPAPTTVVEEPAAAPAPTTVVEAATPAPTTVVEAATPAPAIVVEEPAATPAPTTVVEAATPAPAIVVEEPAATPAPTSVVVGEAASEVNSTAHSDFASKINELLSTESGVIFIRALTENRIIAFSALDADTQASLKKETADAIAGMISDGKKWKDFRKDLESLVPQDRQELPKQLLKSFKSEYKRLITPAEVEE